MSEIRRENPLFDQKLTLLCLSDSHEDSEQEISLKILSGTRQIQINQRENILYFEVKKFFKKFFFSHNFFFLYRLQMKIIYIFYILLRLVSKIIII